MLFDPEQFFQSQFAGKLAVKPLTDKFSSQSEAAFGAQKRGRIVRQAWKLF